MCTKLKLNCWVVGTNLRRAFPVKIQSSESVGTLRKEIQKERKGQSPADTLILWKVSNRAISTPGSKSEDCAHDVVFWRTKRVKLMKIILTWLSVVTSKALRCWTRSTASGEYSQMHRRMNEFTSLYSRVLVSLGAY